MRNKGFTLVELMVTISIVAILAVVAVPAFSDMVKNNRMVSVRNNLLNAIQYARSEAVSRNRSVSICPSTDQLTCAATNDWATGWIVFEDTATGATATVDTIIRVYEGVNGFNVDFVSTGVATTDDFFRFQPTGMLDTEFDSGTFELCDPEEKVDARAIIISPTTGSVRTGVVGDAGC